jgi:cysteine desulfurase
MIYFDYAASTPIDEEVLSAYIRAKTTFYANTASLHKLGRDAHFMVEKAKSELRSLMNIPNHHIVFTSNATEANNLGLFGVALRKPAGRIITTTIEHASVYEPCKHLESIGYDVVYLKVDEHGQIDLQQLSQAMNKQTCLVSIMWVNNIVGSIQPIQKVIEIVKRYPQTILHVDIVQGLGKITPDFSFSDIDMFTMSGHKIYAPKGIGILFYNNKIQLHKRLFGSAVQEGIKPGTFDVGLVVAMTKALKKFLPLQPKYEKEIAVHQKRVTEELLKKKEVWIHSREMGSPYIVNCSFLNKTGETIVRMFEEEGICVSTGSACASKKRKPDRTIFEMTQSLEQANSSVRISFSHQTTTEEVDKLIRAIQKI